MGRLVKALHLEGDDGGDAASRNEGEADECPVAHTYLRHRLDAPDYFLHLLERRQVLCRSREDYLHILLRDTQVFGISSDELLTVFGLPCKP